MRYFAEGADGTEVASRKKKKARAVPHVPPSETEIASNNTVDDDKPPKERSRVAWHDPDDDEIKIDIQASKSQLKFRQSDVSGTELQAKLRSHYKRSSGRTDENWIRQAKERNEKKRRRLRDGIPDSDASTEESEVEDVRNPLRRSGGILRAHAKHGALPSDKIDISQLPNANWECAARAGIRSCQFVASATSKPILAAVGGDNTLSVVKIGKKSSTKISSAFFEDFPIRGMAQLWTRGSSSPHALLMGNNKTLLHVDLATMQHETIPGIIGRNLDISYQGLSSAVVDDSPNEPETNLICVELKDGSLLLVDSRSLRVARSMRMTETSRCGSVFHGSGRALYSIDRSGTIYNWDVGTGGCVQKLRTDIVNPTGLGVCVNGERGVLGATQFSGYCDFFSLDASGLLDPKPFASIGNLTTSATTLAFHPSAEVALVASSKAPQSAKLVHLSSGVVFANFPNSRLRIGTVTSAAFSKKQGVMALGTRRGTAEIFQLSHFS